MNIFFHRKHYLFDSQLKIREMLKALNCLPLWKFFERDSDRWGIYTSSFAERPGVVAVKIIEDQGRYAVNLSYESTGPGAAEDWDKVLRELFERILPAIGAANILETSDYE